MKSLLTLSLLLIPSCFAAYPNGYSYCKTVTISTTTMISGTSNLTNYPFMLSITDADLKTVGNSGKVQNSSGYDIIFVNASACDGSGSNLTWDTERYTATSGALIAWIKFATLHYNSNEVIAMYFGNSSISTYQSTASSVWSAYSAVYHFDNGTTLNRNDATANANNLSTGGTANPTATTGKIDGGGSFTMPTPYSTGTPLSKTSPTGLSNSFPIALETWLQASHDTVGYAYLVQASVFSGGTNIVTLAIEANSDKVYYYQNSAIKLGTTAVRDGTWHHVVIVFSSSSSVSLYIDGNSDTIAQPSGAFSPNAAAIYIAALDNTVSNQGNYAGLLDEVRLSNIDLSADWIKTEYRNQSAPATYTTVGSLQSNTAIKHRVVE